MNCNSEQSMFNVYTVKWKEQYGGQIDKPRLVVISLWTDRDKINGQTEDLRIYTNNLQATNKMDDVGLKWNYDIPRKAVNMHHGTPLNPQTPVYLQSPKHGKLNQPANKKRYRQGAMIHGDSNR